MGDQETNQTVEQQKSVKTNKWKHQSHGKKIGALVVIVAMIHFVLIDVIIFINWKQNVPVDWKTIIDFTFYVTGTVAIVWGAIGSSNWTDVFKAKFGGTK